MDPNLRGSALGSRRGPHGLHGDAGPGPDGDATPAEAATHDRGRLPLLVLVGARGETLIPRVLVLHRRGRGRQAAELYNGRRALNDSAVLSGDLGALAQLTRRGVDYVLIDRVHGTGSRELENAADRVLAEDALLV